MTVKKMQVMNLQVNDKVLRTDGTPMYTVTELFPAATNIVMVQISKINNEIDYRYWVNIYTEVTVDRP